MSLLTKTVSLLNYASFSNIKYSPVLVTYVRGYAARKGTRERRKKAKVKVEEQKTVFIPHNLRDRERLLASRVTRKSDDSWKKLPTDDVYPFRYYKWKVYDFTEAVESHRECNHPEMYNQPSAPLLLTVELNMALEKKNRFVDNFNGIVAIPHKFEHGEERNVVAFSKEPAMVEEVLRAGANLAGGSELIREFQNGNLSVHDFQFVLAHPNILPEMVVLRGLMKKKFPNVKNGTLEVDLAHGVDKFKAGIQYRAVKDEYEKDFGIIQTVLGTIDMDPRHLEANFAAVINDIETFKPKRDGVFITRCLLLSPPSREKLKVDHVRYLKSSKENAKKEEQTEKLAEAVG